MRMIWDFIAIGDIQYPILVAKIYETRHLFLSPIAVTYIDEALGSISPFSHHMKFINLRPLELAPPVPKREELSFCCFFQN